MLICSGYATGSYFAAAAIKFGTVNCLVRIPEREKNKLYLEKMVPHKPIPVTIVQGLSTVPVANALVAPKCLECVSCLLGDSVADYYDGYHGPTKHIWSEVLDGDCPHYCVVRE